MQQYNHLDSTKQHQTERFISADTVVPGAGEPLQSGLG